MVIGNMARATLLERQQQYALLMAENLNHQIYRRFTLPTFLTFGRIALRNSKQFDLLDDVVRSTIHGLPIESLRIFGTDTLVNYSIDTEDLGKSGLAPINVENIFKDSTTNFEILSSMNILHAMFIMPLPKNSFIMRTTFPLSVDVKPYKANDSREASVTGVLVITQDITDDYATIVNFQWILLATCLGTSAVLFIVLQFFIARSERILTARMERTRDLEKTLHDNETLTSMGRIIASIAHEIRNPLGIIRSSSELLLKRGRTNNTEPSSIAMLSAIFDESCRLSRTVNDFLDYARPRKPRQDSVNCALLLDQALSFLHTEFTKHSIELITQLETQLPVTGDKDLIYRAVYNVLTNALQAVGENGIIRVRARCTNKHTVLIEVHDSGPGFPLQSLTNVLEPFFTTKDQGTGLGLPIVNTIIQSHEGTLELTNASPEYGGGAIVRIELPLAHAAIPLSLPNNPT